VGRVSPSSRLVLAVVVFALVVLAVVGSVRPQPAPTPGPVAGATGTIAPSTDASSTGASAATIGGRPSSASAGRPSGGTTPAAATARSTTIPTPTSAGCTPTDQDRYVYHPLRLEVLAPCIRVSGTVAAVRNEADGDLHILLDLDTPYRGLLRPSNRGEELGDLVVEPVCVHGVTQADAVDVCAADPDPLAGPFPSVGQHVWMEGRYVLDLEHGSWAELHPLYRWGPA
jgi:hypothetical protein